MSERLIAEALYPYPPELVIATKSRAERCSIIGERAGPGDCTRPRRRWRSRGCSGGSPVMLLIPGTSRVRHLDENITAALLELSDQDFQELERG